MQVEAELTELDKAEAAEFLASLGAEEGGLRSLIKATYRQLGLLTYFTTGKAAFMNLCAFIFSVPSSFSSAASSKPPTGNWGCSPTSPQARQLLNYISIHVQQLKPKSVKP